MVFMKVLVFGPYDKNQNVNSSRLHALKKAGIEIEEFSSDFLKFNRADSKNYSAVQIAKSVVFFTVDSVRLFFRGLFAKGIDAIFVMHPGYFYVFSAKLLGIARKKKVFFFPLVSIHQTLIFQRKYFKKESIEAKIFSIADKFSCNFSDIIVLDTEHHAKYFSKTFGVSLKKFRHVFIGVDECFTTQKKSRKNKDFEVLFYGSFIPGQALDKILEAAEILREKKVKFTLVGNGPLFEYVKKLAQEKKLGNVVLYGWQPKEKIPSFISKADAGLGLLEDNEKTNLIIGNKVLEMISMKKPVINFNCPGVRELLGNKKSALLINSDPKSIADAILFLKNNPDARAKIGENAYNAFRKNCSSDSIGKKLKSLIEEVL